ncbi:MAG: hypothetical protein ABIJ21_04180 [Nanoarchaeota archaeon]
MAEDNYHDEFEYEERHWDSKKYLETLNKKRLTDWEMDELFLDH